MYARQYWEQIYLFGNSLGAYFSLLTCSDMNIAKALFLSPILDMERLIKDKVPAQEVDSEYYAYVKANPIAKWDIPTTILYGSADDLTDIEVVRNFVQRFNCELTIVADGEHWFHTDEQMQALNKWLIEKI